MVVKNNALIVGCGNMGAALAAGYARAHPDARVLAVDADPARARALLPAASPVAVCASPAELAGFRPDLVVLALKPQLLGEALAAYRPLCAGALVVSIAAGSALSRLRELLGGHRRLARAMPNLAVAAGAGMTTLYGPGLDAADAALCEALFAAVGDAAWVDDEAQIDAATAVAGSGPAYFFALVEQLAAAGAAAGLPPALAERLARRTCIGAAALLAADTRAAGALKAAVCSPRGTTEAGLAALEGGGLAPAVAAAVAAAHRRAHELAAA
ncbi:pyrroline-5-carboxylate reductase [Azospira restricta]|uniref:Pyrroline-5-carboxylate reductase n=1 Tax=Azospira restricta TaxID=404405 RepID=A0A974PW87_9RHOO|nr:pyrroline-5-carboxylate reductase [Azospira restricta]QRJ62238.1 pyrroline-5-carboxylate reductase [Azospira restricta]